MTPQRCLCRSATPRTRRRHEYLHGSCAGSILKAAASRPRWRRAKRRLWPRPCRGSCSTLPTHRRIPVLPLALLPIQARSLHRRVSDVRDRYRRLCRCPRILADLQTEGPEGLENENQQRRPEKPHGALRHARPKVQHAAQLAWERFLQKFLGCAEAVREPGSTTSAVWRTSVES